MRSLKRSFLHGMQAAAFIIALGLSFFCFSSCTHKAPHERMELLNLIKHRGLLIAGVKYDSKPFGYLDPDGHVKGFDIDLLQEAAKRIYGPDIRVEFQQVLSSTRILALNSGNVDIVAATMTITPDRSKIIAFSNPYYVAGQAIIVSRDSAVHQFSDLKNKTILFVLGTTSEKHIKSLLPNAHYLGFKTAIDAFTALKSGRGDAMTTDDTILAGFLQDALCQYKMLPERLSKEPYGLGIRRDSDSLSTSSFVTAVNHALSDMEQDGTMNRLKEKWMKIPTTGEIEKEVQDGTACKLPTL